MSARGSPRAGRFDLLLPLPLPRGRPRVRILATRSSEHGSVGVGAQRSVALANQFDTTVSTVGPTELAQLEQTVDQVKFARTGLMVLVASPTLIATGISLLTHRPREPKVSVAPMASRTLFGLSARVRF